MKYKHNKNIPAIFDVPWAIYGNGFETISNAVENVGAVEAILARPGIQMSDTESVTVRDGVAIIEVIGPVFHYSGGLMSWLFDWPTTEGLIADIQTAEDNPAVKSIVLNIDSPGGEVGGVSELAGHIRNEITKPVVAYVGDMAASAAYWIASAADRIVAADTAELGSIGVVITARRNRDNSIEIVSSVSPKKRVDPETDEGRQSIQARADALADVFVSQVSENRGLSSDQVTAIGGDVVIASKAVEIGLADDIGSLEQVVAIAKNKYYNTREGTMDLAKLKADYPDLYTQAIEVGKAEAKTETENDLAAAKAQGETAKKDAVDGLMEMVAVVLGDDAKAKIDEVNETGMTAEQVKAAQKLFTPEASTPADDSRQAILDGIENGTAGPAPAASNDTKQDDFLTMVTTHQAEHKCKRSEAIGAVAASHPESYNAWLTDQQKK